MEPAAAAKLKEHIELTNGQAHTNGRDRKSKRRSTEYPEKVAQHVAPQISPSLDSSRKIAPLPTSTQPIISLGSFLQLKKKTKEKPAAEPVPPVVLDADLQNRVERLCEKKETDFSDEFLKKLSAQSRSNLIKWCGEKLGQKKWCQENGAAKEALTLLQSRVEKIHNRKIGLLLLEAICAPVKAELIDALCLNIENIISCADLFKLILAALENRDIPEKKKNELTGFTIRWVNENLGTKWLRENAPEIKKIEAHAPQLTKLLSEKKRERSQFLSDWHKADAKSNFEQTLKKIKTESASDSEISALADTCAKDIFHYHVQLFLRVSPGDLVGEKWDKTSDDLVAIESLYDTIAAYVADSIVDSKDHIECSRTLRFFLLLCEASSKLGDFHAATAIWGGLCNASVIRLKTAWNFLREKESMLKLINKFEEVLSVTFNWKNLRSELHGRYAQGDKILPFLPILRKDLEGQQHGISVIEVNFEPRYNLEKMIFYRELLLKALAPIAHMSASMVEKAPNSNFVYLCLEAQRKNANVEERDGRRLSKSQRLEPVKATP